MVTPIGGRRRGSGSGANPSPAPAARAQGTSSKKKKRASPGRPGRSPQNASSHAREAHLDSANALTEGIAQLDGFIEKLSRLRTGDDTEIAEGGRDWSSLDVVKTVEEVIDGNPKPSLEYTLGVLGAERVPKKLGERLRSQGARAFTVELRNRAIQRKKEVMEEKKRLAREARKPPLAPVREAGKSKAVKGKGRGEKEKDSKVEEERKENEGKSEGGDNKKEQERKSARGDKEEERKEGGIASQRKDESEEKDSELKEGEMAEGKVQEKLETVVEEPVLRKGNKPEVAQTEKGSTASQEPTSQAAGLAPRDVPDEVQPAKMDVVEEKSENPAKTVEDKPNSDAMMQDVADSADAAKEPSEDKATKGETNNALEVPVKKEAQQNSRKPSALDKAGDGTSEPAVAMTGNPMEVAAETDVTAAPKVLPPFNNDVSDSSVAAEKVLETSCNEAGKPSEEKPRAPPDLVCNEKSPQTNQIISNVAKIKTAPPADTEEVKPEPQNSAAPPVPMEVEVREDTKEAKIEQKDEKADHGQRAPVSLEENPRDKPVKDEVVQDLTKDDERMAAKPDDEKEKSPKDSAKEIAVEHSEKEIPEKVEGEVRSSRDKKGAPQTSGTGPEKRRSDTNGKETDVEAKSAKDVSDKTGIKSNLATQVVPKEQSSPKLKVNNENNDHGSDSSDAELDMIIDGVIQDASNREKSKSKEQEDQVEKSVKEDQGGDRDVQEKSNLSPASSNMKEEENVEAGITEKTDPQGKDDVAEVVAGSARNGKEGDSTIIQRSGDSGKVEVNTSLQDEALEDSNPADEDAKATVKLVGTRKGKPVKLGPMSPRRDNEVGENLSKAEADLSSRDKEEEITKVRGVSSRDSQPKAAKKQEEGVGINDAGIAVVPRKNKRRKEKIQEKTDEDMEKAETVQDEKHRFKSDTDPKIGINDPKEERRVSKKVRKGSEGPGRPGSAVKAGKKDSADTPKARKAKEAEKTREPPRRGSRRLSFFREDFIDSGSRKTRLRRESSHLGDPTSLPPDTDPFVIDCYHVWKQINQDKITIPFRKPVMKKDAPGYFDVIKHPMDLSTVLQHLEDKTIKTPQDFYDEMILICTNATTFNDKETDLYSLAVELRDKIRKAVRPILKEWRKSMASSKGDGENAGGVEARSASADSSKRSGSEKQVSSESDSNGSSSSSEAKSTQRSGPRYPSRRGGSTGRPSSRGRRRARGRGRGGGRGGSSRRVASESDGEMAEERTVAAAVAVAGRASGRGRGRRGGHVKRSVREPAPAPVKKSKRPRAGGDDDRERKKRRVTARKRWDDE